MAKQDKNTLYSWAKPGWKPLATQIKSWYDSFWHKDEKIPIASVQGLTEALNNLPANEYLDAGFVKNQNEGKQDANAWIDNLSLDGELNLKSPDGTRMEVTIGDDGALRSAKRHLIEGDVKMKLTLQNYEGDTDLAYPLGVFSTTGTYLGIANNADEYIALWNADADNQQLGSILSGVGTTFDFFPIYINAIVNLYALEYYAFTSSSANAVVHADDGDIINYGSTTLLASTAGVSTLSSSLSEYNGIWGINISPVFTFKKVTTATAAGTTIRVFHSRLSRYVGVNILTPYTSLGGVLPKKTKSFCVRGTSTVDFASGIVNWNQLQEMEWYAVENLGGSPYGIGDKSFYPQPPASLLGLSIADYNGAGDPLSASPTTIGWITAANFPNLRILKLAQNSSDPDFIADNLGWFLTMPLVKEQLLFLGVAVTSAANADTAINNLYAAIGSVTPTGVKTIRLKNATARTSASDAAYNGLIAKGWAIQLD